MSNRLIRLHRSIQLVGRIVIFGCLIWFGYAVTETQAVDVNGTGLLLAGIVYGCLQIERWVYRYLQEAAAWSGLEEVSMASGWKPAGPTVISDARRVEIVRQARIGSDKNISISKITVRRMLSRHLSPGNSEYSLDYNVLAVMLGVVTPHIFIDGRSQNRFGAKSQDLWSLTKRLSRQDKLPDLEGDFYRYFDVYAADKRYLSALTIVTPDVMIKLRDNGNSFDYEIYDGYLYVISDPRVTSSSQMQAMLDAAQACLLELVPQVTKHTYDDHLHTLHLSNSRLHWWAIVTSAWVLGKLMGKLLLAVLICIIIGGIIRGLLGHPL